MSPPGSDLFFSVVSRKPLRASAKGSPRRSLSSSTRLVSLFLWLTRPPRAWPTAEKRCMTLSASRCALGQCELLALGSGDSGSSSMLLMDSESGSSEGGRRSGERLGGGSHTPSSIQDTR